MKCILCVSRSNFVPDQGLALLREFHQRVGDQLAGVLILDNRSPSVILRAAAAFALGAWRTAGSLLVHALGQDARIQYCQKAQIPYLLCRDPHQLQVQNWIAKLKNQGLKVGFHVRTRWIFRPELLQSLELGWYNIHHGELPYFRGTSCDLKALMLGRTPGLSLHRMSPRVDQGDIAQVRLFAPPSPLDYASMIQQSQATEAEMLADWLKVLKREGAHAPHLPNHCENPLWCRTPGAWELFKLKCKGVRL